jgi:hypothetical protein
MSDVTIWLALLMLTASVALFVAAPLTEGLAALKRATEREDRTLGLQHDRALAVAAIRELEFDHAMGKIDEGDFATIRATLETRALDAMQGLTQGSSDTIIDGSEPCRHCGALVAGDYPFCAVCGRAVNAEKVSSPATRR